MKKISVLSESSEIMHLLGRFVTKGTIYIPTKERYSNYHMYLLEAQTRLNNMVNQVNTEGIEE